MSAIISSQPPPASVMNTVTNTIAPSSVAAAAVPQPPPPVNEIVDLDAIPGQIGHAILRASDGTILRPPSGSLTERDVGILYRMLLEIGTVLEGEGLQRMTVGFRSVSYAVAFGGGDGCLYIVKKRSSP